MVVGMGIG